MNTNPHLPTDYEHWMTQRLVRDYRAAILLRTQRNLARTRRRLARWATATVVGLATIAAVIALIPPGVTANLATMGFGLATGACARCAWTAWKDYPWDRGLYADARSDMEALPETEVRS